MCILGKNETTLIQLTARCRHVLLQISYFINALSCLFELDVFWIWLIFFSVCNKCLLISADFLKRLRCRALQPDKYWLSMERKREFAVLSFSIALRFFIGLWSRTPYIAAGNLDSMRGALVSFFLGFPFSCWNKVLPHVSLSNKSITVLYHAHKDKPCAAVASHGPIDKGNFRLWSTDLETENR